MEIKVEMTRNPKAKPDPDKLGFGNYFSDHMFIMDYTEGKGWHDPRIVPYGPISYEPSIMVFHYGQSIFEGLKAYRTDKGEVVLFRPDENMKRLNASCDRLCIPRIDEDFAIKALKQLINVDIDWVPSQEGTSLYIRPFIIATDPYLGVRPSYTYQFIIITGPVGAYYKEGINPVKIYVETNYVRAVIGGLGQAKASANYAASLKAQEVAKKKGYTQVLWLDGIEKKYVEEVGTMNVFFVIGDEVVTPALNGSILPGITRKSCIELLRHWGVKVSERRISMEEIYDANEKGQLREAFGTGTAAVISPIGELNWNDKKIVLNDGKIGELSQKLYDNLTGIQYTKVPDPFNWVTKV
ncbi:MAG TPA: branched-chain amino acid aminotransferase [Clostridiaceae bacterium]|nr:branched-chain amino acid aminotransferase [Clostridiaceae bacterium]